MKRILSAVFLSIIVILAPASTQSSRADSPITDFFLGGIEDKIDNVIGRAEQAGNSLILSFAKQAKDLIRAWKEANSELLKQAFDGLDDYTRKMFNEMDDVMTRLENDEELVAEDAQKLTVQWAQVVKSLPFTDHDPELWSYRPRLILPEGENTVALHIFGPKLSSANPEFKSGDKPIALNRAAEQELIVQLDRSNLGFKEAESSYVSFKLAMSNVVWAWYNPWTWNASTIEREVVIWLPPKYLGSYRITSTVENKTTERDYFKKQVNGTGKDSQYRNGVSVPPDKTKDGWILDVDKLVSMKQNEWVSDAGGDHGQCLGYDRDSLSPEGFVHLIQLGHRTNTFGHRSDAHQYCNLTVPIMRTVSVQDPGEEKTGNILWLKDELVTYRRTPSLT